MRLGMPLGLVLLTFWSSAWAGGSDSNTPTITILVYHQEGLSAQTLAAGEQQAAMIFRKAGIETRWADCSAGIKKTDDACRQLMCRRSLWFALCPNRSARPTQCSEWRFSV